MKWMIAVLSLVTLVACGADGEPIQPTGGLSLGISDSGVGGGASIGLRKGWLSLGLGVGLG